MRTSCFLDLDHTLLDTDSFFWTLFSKKIYHLGVSPELWKETYWEIWKGGYSPTRHFKRLIQKRKEGYRIPSISTLQKTFHEISPALRNFLYPDVIPFLQNARKKGIHMYLMTFGSRNYQRWKVRNLSISPYFHKILYLGRNQQKALRIASVNPTGSFVVVDNNPQELDAIKRLFPMATTFWMQRNPGDSVEEAQIYMQMQPAFPHIVVRTLEEVTIPPSEPGG